MTAPSKTRKPWSGATGRIAGHGWMVAAACGAAALTMVLPQSGARAEGGLADLPAVAPAMDCAAVVNLDLTGVTDAPVAIRSATVVTTGAPAPYCEVRGTIAPANTIVMRLPTQGWTQRYLQTGCGGLCGTANISYTQAGACPPVANGTIASATTDMGHQGQNDGDIMFGNFPEFIGQIRDGALRLLAFGGTQPSPLFPDTPLVRDTLPDYTVTNWIGLAGPAGLPGPVVAAWGDALRRIAAGEEFRRRLAENGMELLAGDQDAFRATIAADRRRWGEVIRAAGIRAD